MGREVWVVEASWPETEWMIETIFFGKDFAEERAEYMRREFISFRYRVVRYVPDAGECQGE